MMLRSLDIPAQMAIGFKGGEWNPVGMYYQVQQLHAHTWVEVYLDKGHIPEDAFAFDVFEPPAAWMVLDPTSNSEVGGETDERRGLVARLRQYAELCACCGPTMCWGSMPRGKRRRSTDRCGRAGTYPSNRSRCRSVGNCAGKW